jgi:flagellar motor protein MotB
MRHLPWHGRSAVTDLYPIMAAHRSGAPWAWPGSERKERAINKTVVLLAVALMVGCVSESTYQQEVQQASTLSAQNKTYQALNQQLQAEARADQVQITQLQDRLKVSMVDQLLFSEGGWELHRTGEGTLNKIIPTLRSLQMGTPVPVRAPAIRPDGAAA